MEDSRHGVVDVVKRYDYTAFYLDSMLPEEQRSPQLERLIASEAGVADISLAPDIDKRVYYFYVRDCDRRDRTDNQIKKAINKIIKTFQSQNQILTNCLPKGS